MKIYIHADSTALAKQCFENATKSHINEVKNIEDADVIVVLGGDGFMLQSLHKLYKHNKPFYGVNCGTLGFLMNKVNFDAIQDKVENAEGFYIRPLEVKIVDKDDEFFDCIAINEAYVFRETRQAAKICVSIDGIKRIEEYVGDGMLVSTPVGSTAYNRSLRGAILPIGSNLLNLTPISPFRPRLWPGAILPADGTCIKFDVMHPTKRPVSAVADSIEIKNAISVEVSQSKDICIKLLFDHDHDLNERFMIEQFSQ